MIFDYYDMRTKIMKAHRQSFQFETVAYSSLQVYIMVASEAYRFKLFDPILLGQAYLNTRINVFMLAYCYSPSSIQ